MLYQIGEHILATYLAMVLMTAIKIAVVIWPRHTIEEVKKSGRESGLYSPIIEDDRVANVIRVLSNLIVSVRCGVLWPKEVMWDIKWMMRNMKE